MAHTDLSGPAEVHADARNRAVRTFAQGLLLDLSVALLAVLSVAVTDVRWTREYWLALGLMLAKTAVQAAVSYAARHVAPPPAD